MDRDDITSAFDRYGPAVYRRARYLLGNHEDAEDATQEVFVRAYKSASTYQGDSGVYTWLNRIATNLCLNKIRDRQRRKELWDAEMGSLPVCFPALPSAEGLVWLRRLLAEAEEENARAAVYVLLDGMSHEETAEILGVSRRTVGNRIQRFLEWAKTRMESGTAAPE
jgi:RNA polymerase sigma-70 factor (ECF subfamily)